MLSNPRFHLAVLLVLSILCVPSAQAQKRAGDRAIPTIYATPHAPVAPMPAGASPKTSMARDTLRNFTRSNTVFRVPSSALVDGSTGWIHGTNSFEDQSKATRLTLPAGARNGSVEQVFVTFIHKANEVTTEQYAIEIFDVDGTTGGPGTLLGGQIFSFAFVDADEDLNTPAFTTIHVFDTPIDVPDEFFVVVDFGAYTPADYERAAIASTDFLGRFVSEDWEQLSGGGWINMSTSWFSEANNGWLMWLEAIVQYDAAVSAPPVITHTPITTAPAGEDLTISASITGSAPISVALLAYAPGGTTTTPPILNMTNVGGNQWQVVVPSANVDLRGLRYAIGAADQTGATSNTPDFNVAVTDAEGLSQPLAVNGTGESAYRLVSIPVTVSNASPGTLLEDDLGAYDPASWRLFGLRADQTYAEFPSSGSMTPGAAFWLASSEAGRSITTGPATSVSIAGEYAIPLNPGWTFVGTPFNFPVGRQQVRLASGGTLDIRAFNGSWGAHTGALQPFSGYAVAAVDSDQLLVAPFGADILARTSATPREAEAAVDETGRIDWQIRILAQAEGASDTDNAAVLASTSSPQWDALDRPEAPVIGDYVSVYFGHADWSVPFRRFTTDARPYEGSRAVWTFELSASVDSPITLTFDGVADVPADQEVWLIDHLEKTTLNLRETPNYVVTGSVEAYADRFSLLVGEAAALSPALDAAAELPQDLVLESYPNPFRSSTTIRFALPADDVVTLKVFDLLGKEVATLLSEQSTARGYHTVTWDGLNQARQEVRSGMYLYVLESGTGRATGRVIALR
ncbi:MAG: T9SS type A sorting domain-containing protein [Rhodothermales bacterium]